jgi:hypothetical protein
MPTICPSDVVDDDAERRGKLFVVFQLVRLHRLDLRNKPFVFVLELTLKRLAICGAAVGREDSEDKWKGIRHRRLLDAGGENSVEKPLRISETAGVVEE